VNGQFNHGNALEIDTMKGAIPDGIGPRGRGSPALDQSNCPAAHRFDQHHVLGLNTFLGRRFDGELPSDKDVGESVNGVG
jgi:hypothetical protein